MSTSIDYRPANNGWTNCGGNSSLYQILEDEFGSIIRSEDTNFLRGLVAAGYKEVEELIDALDNHYAIEIRRNC